MKMCVENKVMAHISDTVTSKTVTHVFKKTQRELRAHAL